MENENLKLFNPIAYSNQVVKQFLRYQLTKYKFRDQKLSEQLRNLISFDAVKNSKLLAGPYISIDKPFKIGSSLKQLAKDGIIHQGLANAVPFSRLYQHQEDALKAISGGKSCIITTSTGSGKTESFLYPILNKCFHERDKEGKKEKPGVIAVLIYPMNALANDQLDRIRELLCGTGISFGIYTGQTPRSRDEIQEEYKHAETKMDFKKIRQTSGYNFKIFPKEEKITRDDIAANPPKILITNIYQLEYLLTRPKDTEIFTQRPLEYIVLDEAHSYAGILGAETAILLRRLISISKNLSGSDKDHKTIKIASSATLSDKKNPEMVKEFIYKLMGADKSETQIISEVYETQFWERKSEILYYDKPLQNPRQVFDTLIEGVDKARGPDQIHAAITKVLNGIEDRVSLPKNYQDGLFQFLKMNEYVNKMGEVLHQPVHIVEAVKKVQKSLGRKTKTEDDIFELLLYLALGAIAEKGDAPLIRSKLHYFIRGMQGVVATIVKESAKNSPKIKLYFSGNQVRELEEFKEDPGRISFPVLTCRICGQHYFELQVAKVNNGDESENLSFDQSFSEGEDGYFPTVDNESEQIGQRILITDRIIDFEGNDEKSGNGKQNKNLISSKMCTRCGTLSSAEDGTCYKSGCGNSSFVDMLIYNKLSNVGRSCVACGKEKKNFPIITKLVAATVADVHILGQELIRHLSEASRKLIIFADSRQDAAFQAGWMADKSKTYRIRHLMFEKLKELEKNADYIDSPISFDDLARYILNFLWDNRGLAKLLVPEIYGDDVQEAFGKSKKIKLKEFLDIQLLLEATYSYAQSDNLEGLGLVRYEYSLEPDEKINEIANKLNKEPSNVLEIITLILDIIRKDSSLYSGYVNLFNRTWGRWDENVINHFVPYNAVRYSPKFITLTIADWKTEFAKHNNDNSKNYWIHKRIRSFKNKNLPTKYSVLVSKWSGYSGEDLLELLEELWKWMKNNELIVKTKLVNKKREIAIGETYQVNSSKVGMQSNQTAKFDTYTCRSCYLQYSYKPFANFCPNRKCNGKLNKTSLSDYNYNLDVLQSEFVMVMPKEHTAQVPQDVRKYYEDEFKKTNGDVNCLVATPTLELGIDIGSLDVVLLQNIPPSSASYWQRAGRSGRRNKTGVVFSYARSLPHDSHFFSDPQILLNGKIKPAQFNLKNKVLIRKHIHSIILSFLYHKLMSKSELEEVIKKFFPIYINGYLYKEAKENKKSDYIGKVWTSDEMKCLSQLIQNHESEIIDLVTTTFSENWPEEDKDGLSTNDFRDYINEMPNELSKVIKRLQRKFLWTNDEIAKFQLAATQRDLDKEEQKNRRKFQNLKNSILTKNLNNYTLNKLSNEGFLPSYLGSGDDFNAEANFDTLKGTRIKNFVIQRSGAIALAEYSPGNLIYANGGLFTNAYFEFKANEEAIEPIFYSIQEQIVKDGIHESLGFEEDNLVNLPCVPLADIQLKHLSRVDSENEFRRWMSIDIRGKPLSEHAGGRNYSANGNTIQYIKNQHTLLLNCGTTSQIENNNYGFPICTVCGATRSPFATEYEIEDFEKYHNKHCGKVPERVGLYVKTNVDGIILPEYETVSEVINLCESIILGMANTLQIERTDLSFITYSELPTQSRGFLFDPMKGGSGIINQLLSDWNSIIKKAINYLENCQNDCEQACYGCLKTYWNERNHDILNRHIALNLLKELRGNFEQQEEIPEIIEEEIGTGDSTISTEARFNQYLKERGFHQFHQQVEVEVNFGGVKSSTPDFVYESKTENTKIAIYIDGLSHGIHGNSRTRRIDKLVELGLKQKGWEVIRIPASNLDDPVLLEGYLQVISQSFQK